MREKGAPMRVLAAAKLNLTLDILSRRDDGYHLLDMVMQSVSIYDTLDLSPLPGGEIRIVCDSASVPCGESNTVFRAARAFFRAADIPGGVLVRIKKRIPSEAGLAGGSADAAAALRALNRMYGTGFSRDRLCGIGLQAGSDVPFCIVGGTMRAGGTGEILTPAPTLPPCFFVVCKPEAGVGTAEAYSLADRAGGASGRNTGPMLAALSGGRLEEICACLGNGFEDVIKLEEVEHLKEFFRSMGALGAAMTGSGSAVYGVFSHRVPAEACRAALKRGCREVFVCEPVFGPE